MIPPASIEIEKSVADRKKMDVFDNAAQESLPLFTDKVVEVQDPLLEMVVRQQMVAQVLEMPSQMILSIVLI